MAKRVLVLALVLLLIASLSAFGAKKPVEKKVLPSLEKMKPVDESIIYPYLTTPTPEFKFYFPMSDDTVGYTYYDYQDNSSAHRRVAYDYLGNLHFDWMNMVGPDLSENRFIDYNCRYTSGSWLNPGAGVHVTKPTGRGGYCGLDILPDSREVLAYHDVPDTTYSTLAIEKTVPGAGQFNKFDVRDGNQSSIDDDHLTWPMIATSKHSSTTYIHITGFAQNDYAGYQRCYEKAPDSLICQSPGWTDTVRVAAGYRLKPHGKNKFPYFFNGTQNGGDGKITYIAAPVATSPTGSGHVAIVWYDQTASVFYQGEMYYLQSTNNGDSWMAGGANLIPQKITHWGDNNWEDYDFYYTEVAAVYDYSNVLHVFFTAHATGSEGEDVTLFHWSSATGDTLHKVASRLVTADCGAWSYGIAKPTAGVEYQPLDAAYNFLYVVYAGYNDNDVSLAGYANADIYKKVSATGGRNWGPEVNLTGTNTNGCDNGDCESEAWPSVAERVGDFMYVSYVYDLDASGAITPEGGYTLNPFRYLKDPRELVPEVPGKDYSPKMLISPVRWATNGGTKNDAMTFENTGTDSLYVKITTPTYVTAVPAQFSIKQLSAPVNVALTFSGAGKQDTFLVDQIMIESNNGLLGGGQIYSDTEYAKFHFVVTDTFYYPEYDTADLRVRAVVSNVGNIGNQQDDSASGNGMYYNGNNYLFDFTPVFVTPDIGGEGPVGFTWLHEHHDFLPEAHVKTETYTYKVTVIYDKFGLVFPGRLTSHGTNHSWWSYWTKYSKVMVFDSPPVILVYNWWYWNPPPIWWDDITQPTNPQGGYFGIAADWDVQAKHGSDNWGGYDEDLNLIWQQGDSAEFLNYYGAFQFLDAVVIQGGETTYHGTAPLSAHVLNNAKQLYPYNGYNDDSLYKYMSDATWSVEQEDSMQDNNMVMSMAQVTDPDPTTVIELKYLLLVTDKGLDSLKANAATASWLITHCNIGDANGDGKVSVSDVVHLINYLFKGGPVPVNPSDANGDGKISVSDVVYLINYLFKGGPLPVIPIWCE